ncbi:DUF4365 domain-containing protein [Blastococcus sp. CT_GayMR20]|uniref:DUF4365 domain-containing protein n=1 Tax=Blastococcus sp. CT_GayMR20 TaxID=2559609 RepID=UPI0014314390|nr:DUF4365 domain-containing protein [Blastococcus sp. CT_GayMR20]
MAKRIDVSTHRGDAGVALIHLRTSQIGFVWHDRAVDAGIDGTIEIRDPSTGAMSNRHLLVQSKASARPFPGENDRSFHYTCEQRDIDYWMRAEAPVLLICSHPEREEAWWAHVQAWFSDPVRRASGRIDFDKATQRFDATAAPRLLSLADPHADARLVTAEQRPEVLLANLLPVTIPQTIYVSPTGASTPGEVYQAMRAEPAAATRLDWTLHDGRLFTFIDPTDTALSRAVTRTPEPIGMGEWGTDPVSERNLVRLLNRTLIHDVAGDCAYHAGRDLIYFSATPDLASRKIVGGTGQPRLVFHAKHSKRTGKVSYYKHAALRWQFLHIDEEWLCALTPEAHYTRDGHADSRFIADLLAGLKRLDRNLAVLGHVRMWAAYLRDERTLLDQDTTRLLDFGPLLSFHSEVGIDDADWLTDHRTPPSPPPAAAIADGAPATEDALSLFDEV